MINYYSHVSDFIDSKYGKENIKDKTNIEREIGVLGAIKFKIKEEEKIAYFHYQLGYCVIAGEEFD